MGFQAQEVLNKTAIESVWQRVKADKRLAAYIQ